MRAAGAVVSHFATTAVPLFSILALNLVAADSSFDDLIECLHDKTVTRDPVDGNIYTPDNSSFDYVLRSYIRNRRFLSDDTPKPLLIIAAAHQSHVQAAVVCCKRHGVHLRVRSGGHDYEGLSYTSRSSRTPFVLLDMSRMRSIGIKLEEKTAWVQVGAITGELYYSIAERSNDTLGFPSGVCTGVGLGGHFSGAGYGSMMRKCGLSIDHITDAQLVDVNGKVLNRESMGEDLFWAIRGGGGASFGVILSWTISLVDVPNPVTVFQVDRTIEQGATNLIYRWMRVADKVDDELFIRVFLQVVNKTGAGDKKTVRARFIALFLGNAPDLLKIMGARFPELKLERKDCLEMKWIESVMYWYNFPMGWPSESILNRNLPPPFLKRKSDFIRRPMQKQAIRAVWRKMTELEHVVVDLNPHGGKMERIPWSETPYPHRAKVMCLVQYIANWFEPGKQAADKHIGRIRKMYDFMTPFVSRNPRQAFLNYKDLDIGQQNSADRTDYNRSLVYMNKYFMGNVERLVKVKTTVDPENFFRNEQSIPPLPN